MFKANKYNNTDKMLNKDIQLNIDLPNKRSFNNPNHIQTTHH